MGKTTRNSKPRTPRPAKWYGCHFSPRGELFTPESSRHPAKMAVGLCERIFTHGCARGYWKRGDLVLDPMAGAGFALIERIHAMLTMPETQQAGMALDFHTQDEKGRAVTVKVGATVTHIRERKSFFKRLHEKKYPHLRVDHEDVLFFRKPTAEGAEKNRERKQ
jgi:hypothetical protein